MFVKLIERSRVEGTWVTAGVGGEQWGTKRNLRQFGFEKNFPCPLREFFGMSETAGQSASADMFDRMRFHFRPIPPPSLPPLGSLLSLSISLSLSHTHTCILSHPHLISFSRPSVGSTISWLISFLLLSLTYSLTHTLSNSFLLRQAHTHKLMFSFTVTLSVSFSLFFVTIFFFAEIFTSRQDHSVSLIGTRHKWISFYIC